MLNKITRKQKTFADHLLANPKASLAQAAEAAYVVKNKHVAQQIAYENMRKPDILRYLKENSNIAEKKVVELAGSSNERIALDASKDILDRTFGRATQTVHLESRVVQINIDLTGGSTPG